jgi:hypothetical protein
MMHGVADLTVSSLAAYLGELAPQQRAARVAGHPRAYARPRPRTVRQLAVRLVDTTVLSLDGLTQGELQLLEAAVALSAADRPARASAAPSCALDAVHLLTGTIDTPGEAYVAELLDALAARMLAWPWTHTGPGAHGGTARVMLHPKTPDLFRSLFGSGIFTIEPGQLPARAPLARRPEPRLRAAKTDTATPAAAAALHTMDRLLEALATPWPALAQRGMGVREVRRLARTLGCSDTETRLWLHLADELGLIEPLHGGWQRLSQGAVWHRADPAARLVDLGRALLGMSALPLLPTSGVTQDLTRRTQPAAALSTATHDPAAPEARRALWSVLADLPADHTVHAPDPEQVVEAVAALVYYRAPRLFAPPGHTVPRWADSILTVSSPWHRSTLGPEAGTGALLHEAALIGAVADGALTELGRALLAADGDPLDAARAVLPLQDKAKILADHTVIVPGVPTRGLAALLDAVAEPRRGDPLARTWRITPASVRSYLDDHPGTDADHLTEALAAVSSTELPQPLTYLLHDAAGRHGHIAVLDAATVLEVRSTGLAAEIAAHRDLRDLGLRQVAPTVLVATAARHTVLARLREAGYAPTPPATTPAPARPLADTPPPKQRRTRRTGPPKDYAAWIEGLADGDGTVPDGLTALAADLLARIRRAAPQLGVADCAALAAAIAGSTAVHIEHSGWVGHRRTTVLTAPRLTNSDTELAEAAHDSRERITLTSVRLALPAP